MPLAADNKVTDVHDACSDLVSTLTDGAASLRDVLEQHVDENLQSSVVGENGDSTTSSMALTSLQSTPPRSMWVDDDIPGILFRESFDFFVHNIATFSDHFVVNSEKGAFRRSPFTSEWFLEGAPVKALSMVPNSGGEVLVIAFDELVQVYQSDALGSPPLYSLPTPVNMPNNCVFDCVGATNSSPNYFLISDIANSCIHVWCSVSHGWCDIIDVRRFTASLIPSFQMCVYNEDVYASFYNEGRIYALSLDGDVLWCNHESFHKPNGITADNSGIYVCESHHGYRCIEVLNHDGSHRQSILSDFVYRPWSIAKFNNVLAVVERRYIHYRERGSIHLTFFDLRAVH